MSADESLAAAREDLPPAPPEPISDASLIDDATWNDEPVQARRVVVIVGEARSRGYWSEHLVGQQRNAIEVKTHRRERFFLDDDGGVGERKVTSGDWREPYALLPVQRILGTRSA